MMATRYMNLSISGICRLDGQSNAVAAIGASFEAFPDYDISKVALMKRPTGEKAELVAVLRSLEQAFIIANLCFTKQESEENHGAETSNQSVINLRADTNYVVDGILNGIPRWKENGYKTSEGNQVANSTLFKQIDELISKVFPEIQWAVAIEHTATEQTRRANALATQALDRKSGLPGEEPLSEAWIISNMPSQHMCHQRELFTNFAWISPLELETHTRAEDKAPLHAIGTGAVELEVLFQDGTSHILALENVLYVPHLILNLLSERQFHVEYPSGTIKKNGLVVGYAPRRSNLFVLQLAHGPCAVWPPELPDDERPGIMASDWIKGDT